MGDPGRRAVDGPGSPFIRSQSCPTADRPLPPARSSRGRALSTRLAETTTMASQSGGGSIESVLVESRVFPPPEAFARAAHISSLDQYESTWNRAKDDPEGFWAEQADA